ncbi:MAG: carbohydrate deacetylase [Gemmatimonas sp.]
MTITSSLSAGVIVNADDLGIHPRINEGIVDSYRRGMLTSCTMLMTTAYVEETVRDVVRPAVLPIGIHLSLTLGKSVAGMGKVPDLVDGDGNLSASAGRLLLSSFSGNYGRRLLAQIRAEWEAQLALACDYGLHPTHADSHQHVHMHPALFAIAESLLPRFGIHRIRLCREDFPSFALGTDLPGLAARLNPLKWAILRWRAGQIRPTLETPERFFGVLYSGVINKAALRALLRTTPPGRSLEIGIHPGFPVSGGAHYPRRGYNAFIAADARQKEHDILTDPTVRDDVRRFGLTLRSYADRKQPA